MKRRSFIAGMAATPVLALLPLPALAAPQMESPLFGPVSVGQAHAIRVRYQQPFVPSPDLSPHDIAKYYTGRAADLGHPDYHPNMPRLRIAVERIQGSHDVFDAVEAENMLFERATNARDVCRPMQAPSCVGDWNPPFYIVINRASNLIAARTRRGAGNMVFMHPDNMQYLRSLPSAFVDSPVERAGRWEKIGRVNGVIQVYTSDTMPLNAAYVVYRGSTEIDAPAFLVSTKEGRLQVGFLEHTETSLGNSSDYIQKVRIERA